MSTNHYYQFAQAFAPPGEELASVMIKAGLLIHVLPAVTLAPTLEQKPTPAACTRSRQQPIARGPLVLVVASPTRTTRKRVAG